MPLGTSARALGSAVLLVTSAGATLALAIPAAAATQLGGWRSVSTGDAGVQAAASFAAGELGGSLASVDSAQSQSAAGTNYRLGITLEGGAVWAVTVHRDLQGGFSLQSSSQTSAGSGTSGEDEPDAGSNQAPDEDGPDTGSSQAPEDDDDPE